MKQRTWNGSVVLHPTERLQKYRRSIEKKAGFNVTIVTSANTQDETLPPWSSFLQKDKSTICLTHAPGIRNTERGLRLSPAP
ncbi:hypothetical protein H5410_017254 [Solanum commersonii]|uniref:Uncharacterized protein n=1 Tax=Solanum commersonii TaxID=4109 RepID=A0A9J5ZYK4_SOLCO|nr:hypothetical protein H5410_017254 [Solanum commersonii]